MRNRLIISILMAACAATSAAQEQADRHPAAMPPTAYSSTPEAAEMPMPDTLALPRLTERGTISRYPAAGPLAGWNDWGLHGGLNASLSLSATVGLGRHSGSGFAQSLALMYATELMPRLSMAVGGYYSHFNWGPAQFNDAGLTAVLGYRFNEHWEAYLFGQKSIATPRMPAPLYYLGDFGDKIGVELRYNVSPSFSIGISVWHQDVPDNARLAPKPRP